MNINVPIAFLLLFVLPGIAGDKATAHKTITINTDFPDPYAWLPSFSSLEEFVKTVEPPESTLLAARDTGSHYLALFRTKNDRIIFSEIETSSHFVNGSLAILTQQGAEATGSTLAIPLVDFVASKTYTAEPVRTISVTHSIYGYSFQIKPGITGSLILEYEVWNEGSGQPRTKVIVPFIWKQKMP